MRGILYRLTDTAGLRESSDPIERQGVARTEWDAPEIDGTVYVDKTIPVGTFSDVTINDWRGYDLVAAR